MLNEVGYALRTLRLPGRDRLVRMPSVHLVLRAMAFVGYHSLFNAFSRANRIIRV
jgi:hypothetical protein